MQHKKIEKKYGFRLINSAKFAYHTLAMTRLPMFCCLQSSRAASFILFLFTLFFNNFLCVTFFSLYFIFPVMLLLLLLLELFSFHHSSLMLALFSFYPRFALRSFVLYPLYSFFILLHMHRFPFPSPSCSFSFSTVVFCGVTTFNCLLFLYYSSFTSVFPLP